MVICYQLILVVSAADRASSFILPLTSVNIEPPQLLRTYESQYQRSISFPIWQAARATETALTIFKPISIDPGQDIETDSIDAGLHSDNPMRSSMEEARECYGDNRRVRCILSVGTGYPGVVGLSEKGIHAVDLFGALKKLAGDSIQEYKQWATRFTDSETLVHALILTMAPRFLVLGVEYNLRLLSPC